MQNNLKHIDSFHFAYNIFPPSVTGDRLGVYPSLCYHESWVKLQPNQDQTG